MATLTPATKEKILQTSVDELRRKYDELCSDYDQLRIKILAFITGELALIAFVFATGIKVPHVVYGIVFFLCGAGCVAISFALLLILLTTIIWSSPIHPDTLENQDYNSFPTHAAFLEHICKCYSDSLRKNYKTFSERARLFDKSLMLLFIGVIILLIIKFGQGVVLWHNILMK
jgi:hypothetical protein